MDIRELKPDLIVWYGLAVVGGLGSNRPGPPQAGGQTSEIRDITQDCIAVYSAFTDSLGMNSIFSLVLQEFRE